MTEVNPSFSVSIIIPTRNRPDDLRRLLDSIIAQTILPDEVIIVDDSEDNRTRDLVVIYRNKFSLKGVNVKYIRGGEQGVAQKRNIGVSHSTGSICFFIDDDMILDKKYVEKILEVYATYPNALGVAGHIVNFNLDVSLKSKFSRVMGRLLLIFNCAQDTCKVRPIGITYPYPLTKIINCEWLNAGSVSYRKKVFDEFKWDENLKTYSISEDKDLSYRIYQRYPNSLFMTPYAKIFHTVSPAARFPKEYVIYMGVAHTVYVFYKNFKQTLKNNIVFFWGLLFGHLLSQILTRNPYNVIYQIRAYFYVFKNFKEIKSGNFTFLETFIK
ncbi:MAG: glycosyltransferase family 2 protein [Candidatus Bathyarchaeia archaeon]